MALRILTNFAHRSSRIAAAHIIVVVCGLAGGAEQASAQTTSRNEPAVELKAEVNARQVREGDIFQLDFTLTLRTNAAAESFRVPSMSDFEVVRSQRAPTSSKTTIINGRRSSEQRMGFTYLLRAKTPGKYTIDSATVEVSGRTFRSAPIEIEVMKQGDRAGVDSTALDPGARFGAGNRPPSYFLDVRFEKDQVYVGEQVILTVQLYAREQTEIEINDFNAPKPNGFWAEVLDSPDRVRPTQRSVADETFLVYPLMRIALFPLDAGEQKIESIPLGLSVSRGGFWGRRKQMTLTSEPVRLTVLPLPPEGRPENFVDGNVGRYSLRTTTDKKQVRLGQPVTLRVRVFGEGNIGALSLPSVPAKIAGARIFPPSTTESKSTDGPRVKGEKVQEVLVQPTQEGRFVIPGLVWTYFDPTAARFVEERTRAIEVEVLPSQMLQTSADEDTDLRKKIRPFRTKIQPESDVAFWPSPSVSFSLLSAWLGCLAIAALGIRRRRFAQSVEGKAKVERTARMRRMQEALHQGHIDEVERIVMEAICARCGERVRALRSEQMAAGLRELGMPPQLAERCGAFLIATQAIRYAPESQPHLGELSTEGLSLLTALEAWEK